MKRSLLICTALFTCVHVFAQYEQFTPIELQDLPKYFAVHSQDEGPGKDYYGSLLLRLHLNNRVEPIQITDYDQPFLASILKQTQSRFSASDHHYKYYFEFPSNAEWKKDKAVLSIFINDELLKSYNDEIQNNDEFWIFFIITEYNTFKMEGYGRVADFMNKEQMKKNGLSLAPSM